MSDDKTLEKDELEEDERLLRVEKGFPSQCKSCDAFLPKNCTVHICGNEYAPQSDLFFCGYDQYAKLTFIPSNEIKLFISKTKENGWETYWEVYEIQK